MNQLLHILHACQRFGGIAYGLVFLAAFQAQAQGIALPGVQERGEPGSVLLDGHRPLHDASAGAAAAAPLLLQDSGQIGEALQQRPGRGAQLLTLGEPPAQRVEFRADPRVLAARECQISRKPTDLLPQPPVIDKPADQQDNEGTASLLQLWWDELHTESWLGSTIPMFLIAYTFWMVRSTQTMVIELYVRSKQ